MGNPTSAKPQKVLIIYRIALVLKNYKRTVKNYMNFSNLELRKMGLINKKLATLKMLSLVQCYFL